MLNSSFKNQKFLEFEITLGDDESTGPKNFPASGTNRITIKEHRANVSITNAGQQQFAQMQCKIWGISQSNMNAITTLKLNGHRRIDNSILVYAVDGTARSLVFAGNIVTAWADYESQPSVNLDIFAQSSYLTLIRPQPSKSFKGEIDAATILEQLAKEQGLAFEKNAVSVMLRDVALTGSLPEMAVKVASMANVNMYVDRGTMAIWNADSSRANYYYKINANNGLVGYPTYDGSGIGTKVLYNSDLVVGGVIDVDSEVVGAKGKFYIMSINHQLDSNLPGGAWFSQIRANSQPYSAAQ